MPKLKNSNATFLVIFKHCVTVDQNVLVQPILHNYLVELWREKLLCCDRDISIQMLKQQDYFSFAFCIVSLFHFASFPSSVIVVFCSSSSSLLRSASYANLMESLL